MLVLMRREQEVLWIGDISIRITRAKEGRAELGIEADRSIPIVRGELRARSSGKMTFIPKSLLDKLPRILSYVAESSAGTPEADCAELARLILGQVKP